MHSFNDFLNGFVITKNEINALFKIINYVKIPTIYVRALD